VLRTDARRAVVARTAQVTLLARAGAAPDHPINPAYPEGEYLTALLYRVL
jgi:23S rRNA G2069 N7-methylase RlmK/C1962 C5-methylase RlmI